MRRLASRPAKMMFPPPSSLFSTPLPLLFFPFFNDGTVRYAINLSLTQSSYDVPVQNRESGLMLFRRDFPSSIEWAQVTTSRPPLSPLLFISPKTEGIQSVESFLRLGVPSSPPYLFSSSELEWKALVMVLSSILRPFSPSPPPKVSKRGENLGLNCFPTGKKVSLFFSLSVSEKLGCREKPAFFRFSGAELLFFFFLFSLAKRAVPK